MSAEQRWSRLVMLRDACFRLTKGWWEYEVRPTTLEVLPKCALVAFDAASRPQSRRPP